MLEIELNGAPHVLPGAPSLHELVDMLELSGQALAMAVNHRVVPREQWRTTLLQPRDQVDVVRAIGGG